MIWKHVPSYDIFEVSDTGLVRNTATGNILSQTIRKGYRYIGTTHHGNRIDVAVHRLVCEAFHGPSELTVDHINRVKGDNRPDNLRWMTRNQNTSIARAGSVASEHTKCIRKELYESTQYPNAKLDRNQILEIRRKRMFGISYKNLAAEYSTPLGTIKDVLSGKSWKYVQ